MAQHARLGIDTGVDVYFWDLHGLSQRGMSTNDGLGGGSPALRRPDESIRSHCHGCDLMAARCSGKVSSRVRVRTISLTKRA